MLKRIHSFLCVMLCLVVCWNDTAHPFSVQSNAAFWSSQNPIPITKEAITPAALFVRSVFQGALVPRNRLSTAYALILLAASTSIAPLRGALAQSLSTDPHTSMSRTFEMGSTPTDWPKYEAVRHFQQAELEEMTNTILAFIRSYAPPGTDWEVRFGSIPPERQYKWLKDPARIQLDSKNAPRYSLTLDSKFWLNPQIPWRFEQHYLEGGLLHELEHVRQFEEEGLLESQRTPISHRPA